jgi:hypothetical protein
MERRTSADGCRSLGFSFNRWITNMMPNNASSATPDSLTVAEIDKLFDFQVGLREPKRLGVTSLYIMGIAKDDRTAAKVVDRLLKIGVFKQDGSQVETKAITLNFANQLSWLPSHCQKRLICVLFAWEEELIALATGGGRRGGGNNDHEGGD